jgi:hypothetical protein
MAREKNLFWTELVGLARLPHATTNRDISSDRYLNTQDHRDYGQNRQSIVGNEGPAWVRIRDSLDNLGW